ncbi:hypothetical protein Syun_017109 [Stephania yunnanensis]|uniref:Uncharacterized protein n=1 Tax=Stephania yunnanensis TaxID=152371 RepID=A0AAP0J8N2_9MAGN
MWEMQLLMRVTPNQLDEHELVVVGVYEERVLLGSEVEDLKAIKGLRYGCCVVDVATFDWWRAAAVTSWVVESPTHSKQGGGGGENHTSLVKIWETVVTHISRKNLWSLKRRMNPKTRHSNLSPLPDPVLLELFKGSLLAVMISPHREVAHYLRAVDEYLQGFLVRSEEMIPEGYYWKSVPDHHKYHYLHQWQDVVHKDLFRAAYDTKAWDRSKHAFLNWNTKMQGPRTRVTEHGEGLVSFVATNDRLASVFIVKYD